ncbi:uncharacterized protein PHALS_08516 [Plasmopara halstedii]|uniref:EF-hand domain pair n=1 Tax=Plasmopara halstedii TaxID=4781 RepID=A0A0P1ADB7_PLAHL|nr:uncharacterized protein PHALS_08516 [Plasmopara halstedii]CEG38441.1 hypothetical protein PHALS_08516 [Plasmopara halstedii]|eukprot:XP_024574810.1 hypothetical protein PHALS_08516 [Plasmopara halstedii]
MENRAFTAPITRSEKSLNDSFSHAIDASIEKIRPRTCPIATLTPQFHWNLNDIALQTLSKDQMKQLYGLFQFYDSSTFQETVPSISCTRFQEILRDANLISDHLKSKKLRIETVERVFAQATLGQMRIYLDVDDQPVLTFPLFCGALLNCAMLLHPLARPANALQDILSPLLENISGNNPIAFAETGLLRHVPRERHFWRLEQTQVTQNEASVQDFRRLNAFRQVIADCSRDKSFEERRQEEVEASYQIPDHLRNCLQPDTLDLIVTKFRTFDFNDCGSLPQQEIFSLLSCLGSRKDLPDPYVVLAKLSVPTVDTLELDSSTSSEKISLIQLLEGIDLAKKTSRKSFRLAVMKCRMIRAAVTKSDKSESIPPHQIVEDNIKVNENLMLMEETVESKESEDSRDCGREQSTAIENSCSPIMNRSNSSQTLLSTKDQSSSKSLLQQPLNTKTSMLQTKSIVLNQKSKASVIDVDLEGSVMPMQCLKTTTSFTVKVNDDRELENSTIYTANDRIERQLNQLSREETLHKNDNFSSIMNKKMIRIFMLLGGEHDGAMYCTLSLVFATKKIQETEGIYYTTSPCETTHTSPVLPTQNDLIHSLVMLKKCVNDRLEQGYELRPEEQLEKLDKLLQDRRNRQPHYSRSLTKTFRDSTAAVRSTLLSSSSHNAANATVFKSTLKTSRQRKSTKFESRELKLPNNLQDMCTAWNISQHENFSWIHDLNAASPLKLASQTSNRNRNGILNPLCYSLR